MITSAIYKGSKENIIYIEPDNKNVKADYPELILWVEAGNTIAPYIEPMGDSKIVKYAEIYAYADSLIEAQEAAFYPQGSNPGRNKERLLRAQNKRNNKKIAGQPLNPNEEDADNAYDVFMDWADTIYDTADLAEDAVELMVNVEDVKSYDVMAINWPIL